MINVIKYFVITFFSPPMLLSYVLCKPILNCADPRQVHTSLAAVVAASCFELVWLSLRTWKDLVTFVMSDFLEQLNDLPPLRSEDVAVISIIINRSTYIVYFHFIKFFVLWDFIMFSMTHWLILIIFQAILGLLPQETFSNSNSSLGRRVRGGGDL